MDLRSLSEDETTTPLGMAVPVSDACSGRTVGQLGGFQTQEKEDCCGRKVASPSR